MANKTYTITISETDEKILLDQTHDVQAWIDGAVTGKINYSWNNMRNTWTEKLMNDDTFTDADISAGLPQLFTELQDAWISAVNIEITGTVASPTLTRKSAPCGQTAPYCLGADGYDVYGVSNAGYYWPNTGGTSFVAPQISGAIALLAEAFPNQTPAQWTDRLLASADNATTKIGAHSGATTFGNGDEHGYNTTFGHGIMDI